MQFKREQIAFSADLAAGAPVIWTEHGRWLGGLFGGALRNRYAAASRHVSRIVCVSGEVAADLAEFVNPKKLVVIPNAVDTNRYSVPDEESKRLLRDRLLPEHWRGRAVAVMASRLSADKRHDRAIALARAAEIPLAVVGDGPDRGRLEEVAAGSPDVLFLGYRQDIQDVLKAADCYIYSGGRTDGMPMAVLEAGATGLPLVGFAGDPGSDVITNSGGLLIGEDERPSAADLAALVAKASTSRDYVLRHHGKDRWLDAFEALFSDVTGT